MKNRIIVLLMVLSFTLTACGSPQTAEDSSVDVVQEDSMSIVEDSTSVEEETTEVVEDEQIAVVEEEEKLELPKFGPRTGNENFDRYLDEIETIIFEERNNVRTKVGAIAKDISDYDSYVDNINTINSVFDDVDSSTHVMYEKVEKLYIEYCIEVASDTSLIDFDDWDEPLQLIESLCNEDYMKFFRTADSVYKDVFNACDNAISPDGRALDNPKVSDIWSEMEKNYNSKWNRMKNKRIDASFRLGELYLAVYDGLYDNKRDVAPIIEEQLEKFESSGRTY